VVVVLVVVLLVLVVAGGAVVVVVTGATVVGVGTTPGESSPGRWSLSGVRLVGVGALNGTGAFGPFSTYTGVPTGSEAKIQSAEVIGTRTQPCEAGPPGTESAPWMAIPPLKYDGL
jgi:hypothetical protein